jgi:hypothetical protein
MLDWSSPTKLDQLHLFNKPPSAEEKIATLIDTYRKRSKQEPEMGL